MEVVSAGAFPEGVILEQVLRLERVHRSRNPRIVRAPVDLGYARGQGEGIPRMFTLSPALREHIGGSSGTDRGELGHGSGGARARIEGSSTRIKGSSATR